MYEQAEVATKATGDVMLTSEQYRWVPEQLDSLGNGLAEAEKAIESLGLRLGPVLAPDSPHSIPSDKVEAPSCSPLADDLAGKASRIFVLAERISRIEGRLEI